MAEGEGIYDDWGGLDYHVSVEGSDVRIAMSTDSSSALRLQGFSPILQGELRMLYNLCLAMWRGMTTGMALTRISRRI